MDLRLRPTVYKNKGICPVYDGIRACVQGIMGLEFMLRVYGIRVYA